MMMIRDDDDDDDDDDTDDDTDQIFPPVWGRICESPGSRRTLESLEGQRTAMEIIIMIVMVTQHIPTMTKSHHGGEVSVMMKVGMCQCQKPTKHHTP